MICQTVCLPVICVEKSSFALSTSVEREEVDIEEEDRVEEKWFLVLQFLNTQ